jgi:hypothetical protein
MSGRQDIKSRLAKLSVSSANKTSQNSGKLSSLEAATSKTRSFDWFVFLRDIGFHETKAQEFGQLFISQARDESWLQSITREKLKACVPTLTDIDALHLMQGVTKLRSHRVNHVHTTLSTAPPPEEYKTVALTIQKAALEKKLAATSTELNQAVAEMSAYAHLNSEAHIELEALRHQCEDMSIHSAALDGLCAALQTRLLASASEVVELQSR